MSHNPQRSWSHSDLEPLSETGFHFQEICRYALFQFYGKTLQSVIAVTTYSGPMDVSFSLSPISSGESTMMHIRIAIIKSTLG